MGKVRLPPRRTEGGRDKILDEVTRCRELTPIERLELLDSMNRYVLELHEAGRGFRAADREDAGRERGGRRSHRRAA